MQLNFNKIFSKLLAILSGLATLQAIVEPMSAQVDAVAPDLSYYLGLAGIVGAATTGAVVNIKKLNAKRKQSSLLVVLLLALVVPFTMANKGCDAEQTIRTAGAVTKAAASEAQREVRDMVQSGEIPADTADKLAAAFYEAESLGHTMTLYVNWNSLPTAERREVALNYISKLEGVAHRLDAAGLLGIKSDKARKRMNSYKRGVSRGLGILRAIEASLPREDAPQPSPAPTPTPAAN